MKTAYKEEIMNTKEPLPGALNHQSPIPLYRQLADILSEMIRKGRYPVQGRIPSENQLAATYGIGRPTARQATEYLIRKGLLVRKRGSGTYVQEITNDIDLFSLGGTLSAFQKEGIDIQSRFNGKIKRIHIPDEADNPFSGLYAFFLSRISSVAGTPLLLEEMYISTMLFPGMDAMDLSGKSISRVVEEVYYMKPTGGKQTFRVAKPGPHRGLQLGIDEKEPVLQVKRFINFPQAENGIYSELFCLTDRFVFSQNLGGI
jgi:GntR family transcriptional regulator